MLQFNDLGLPISIPFFVFTMELRCVPLTDEERSQTTLSGSPKRVFATSSRSDPLGSAVLMTTTVLKTRSANDMNNIPTLSRVES